MIQIKSGRVAEWYAASEMESVEALMTNVPVDIHKNPANNLPAIPEPWRWRDTLLFTFWGLLLFSVLFAFMFALGNM